MHEMRQAQKARLFQMVQMYVKSKHLHNWGF
jgi:hypothetical protein